MCVSLVFLVNRDTEWGRSKVEVGKKEGNRRIGVLRERGRRMENVSARVDKRKDGIKKGKAE